MWGRALSRSQMYAIGETPWLGAGRPSGGRSTVLVTGWVSGPPPGWRSASVDPSGNKGGEVRFPAAPVQRLMLPSCWDACHTCAPSPPPSSLAKPGHRRLGVPAGPGSPGTLSRAPWPVSPSASGGRRVANDGVLGLRSLVSALLRLRLQDGHWTKRKSVLEPAFCGSTRYPSGTCP